LVKKQGLVVVVTKRRRRERGRESERERGRDRIVRSYETSKSEREGERQNSAIV
jgi:hypothetical protein